MNFGLNAIFLSNSKLFALRNILIHFFMTLPQNYLKLFTSANL